MTKPSGTADEVLQLPSGGGSVSGPGTSFDVDLNTGTLTAAIDFNLPTGPNAIAPKISLAYSSAAGDGPFGRGWSLGTLAILRKIVPSLESQPAAADSYSMTGVGELIDMGGGRYRPAVDTTGQLIEFTSGSWKVTDTRDTSFTLGTTAAAQVGGNPPAAWLLDGVTDSLGNTVSYTWKADPGGTLIPDTVAWGTYQLVFRYEARPDVLLNASYGAPLRLTQRCSAIELHVTTEAVSLVRSWQLSYYDGSGLARSFLNSVVEKGHAADGTVLPAPGRSFTYTSMGQPAFVPVTGWLQPLVDADTDLVDLHGDGLPDFLRMGAAQPTVSPNLGGGSFGFPRALSRAPSPVRLSAPQVTFADMSGAGSADLMVLDTPFAGYYPLRAPGGTAPAGFSFPVVFERAPNVMPGDRNVRFLDLNGDGITDVLYDTGRAWLGYLRQGDASWADYPVVLPPSRTPPVHLSDPHVYLADMTGDGYTDIVLVDGGGVTYWPGRADGGWGDAVQMSGAPVADRDWQPERVAFFDLDGDGCADLVYTGPTSVTVWMNTGADRLAVPLTIDHTPLAGPGSYRLVDLLGRGTTGIHFELPEVRSGQVRQTFLDLSGGSKPGLLATIANGPSRTTTVTYRTSTEYAQDDAAAGSPWPTYHPFPVQCVERTDQTDQATGVTGSTRYEYHDGRYDPATRTFLGFGRTDTYLLGDASCPTLRTETVFHLGLDPSDPSRPLSPDEALQLGALRRKVLKTTVWGLDGTPEQVNPYSVTTTAYAAKLFPSALSGGGQAALSYTTATTEERWERQPAAISTRVVQYLQVDDDGDITLQRTTATRAGSATPDQDVITATTFATGGHNIRLPARVTQTLPDGTLVCTNVTFYDGPAYVGLPEGQATQGCETRIEDLALTDAMVATIFGANPPDLTAYGYHRLPGDQANWWIIRRAHARSSNAAGPTLSTRGPLGAIQVLQLDAAGQRAVGVTDSAGNTMTAAVDPRVWQTGSLTDQNGNTTRDVFDALGRVTATVMPGDTAAFPWAAYEYAVGAVSTATASVRVEHGQPATINSITYLDGSGAVLAKAEPASAPGQWVLSRAAACNGRGLTTAAYFPYPVAVTGWAPPPAGTPAATYEYDALGRTVRKTRPDGLVVATRREGDTIVTSEQWPGRAPADVERQTYDAAGQLISVSRNAGSHWVEQVYAYTPGGRMTAATLPNGSTVTLGYDLMGRRFRFQSPDTGSTVYVLDACGNERLRTLATGQQVRSEVDALNRVTGIFHDAEAAPRVSYSYYDEGGPAPADGITVNRAGRVWQVRDELGTVTMQYDEAGHVTNYERVIAATGASYTESSEYDALGRPISMTLPSTTGSGTGRTVGYDYGPDGRLKAATGVVTAASYDLLGRPTTIEYANGSRTVVDYRPNGGTIARVRVFDPGGVALRDVSVAVADSLITSVSSATTGDDSAAFSYDGLRRLTAAGYTQGATALDTHSWEYDDDYNVVSASDAGALSYLAGTHQLASVAGQAVSFDAAGRMLAGRFGQMTFDSSDHLAEIRTPQGHTVAHTYGFQGIRVQTLIDGAASFFAPTANFVVQQGSSVAWIRFGPLRIAAEVDGTLWFLHTNTSGDMDLVTNGSGQVAARGRLTPYGYARPSGGSQPPPSAALLTLLLSGLDVTGLVCQGHRWYDPALGQFVSPDPFVNGIFTVGIWNPYLYCLGNPMSLSDPSGCNFLDVLGFIAIAVIAAACVVGAIWTGGATLLLLGVVTSNLSTAMLVSVSIGALGGAVAGEMSAQKAGGNVWAGAFLGAFLGGTSTLAGGALASVVGGALKSLPFLQYLLSGAIEGAYAGAFTGMAIGYRGGKGSAEQVWSAVGQGAAWGATLGGLLGGASYFLVGNVPAGMNAYLQVGNILNKYDPDPAVQGADTWDSLNAVDNQWGLGNDIGQLAHQPSLSTGLGLAPDFIGLKTTSETLNFWWSGGSVFNIPLGWVPSAVLNGGGFGAAVQVSFAADQLGVSYADQITMLFKAAPYFVDMAVTIFSEWDADDPNGAYNKWGNGVNKAYGSADQNEYPHS